MIKCTYICYVLRGKSKCVKCKRHGRQGVFYAHNNTYVGETFAFILNHFFSQLQTTTMHIKLCQTFTFILVPDVGRRQKGFRRRKEAFPTGRRAGQFLLNETK
jgi:hypothetical protein